VGFLIIPARRRQAKATLEEKVAALRARLRSALEVEFNRAREQSRLRLADAVAPYSRFVRAEDGRWRAAHDALRTLLARAAAILARLGTEPSEVWRSADAGTT